jgi:hypothetical protein
VVVLVFVVLKQYVGIIERPTCHTTCTGIYEYYLESHHPLELDLQNNEKKIENRFLLQLALELKLPIYSYKEGRICCHIHTLLLEHIAALTEIQQMLLSTHKADSLI